MIQEKKGKTLIKAVSSVLLAVIASSHHWLHTLLIALGLTSLGAGLLSLPPFARIMIMIISIAVSLWFLNVCKRKWRTDRPAAWVYLISSIVSIILVMTSVPQTIADFNPETVQQEQQNHSEHHEVNE